jgi:hypothetical protein
MELKITRCIHSKVPQEDAASYLSEAVSLRTSILALAHQSSANGSVAARRRSGATLSYPFLSDHV